MRKELYKLDCNGKVREWTCWTEDSNLIIRFGLLNGSKVFERYTLASPQEAEVQAERRCTKQMKRRGYIETIPTSKPFGPMLAHTFQDHNHHMPDKVIFQPKFDGFRCIGSKVKMTTRTNVELPAFPHIQYALSFLPEDILLDGELYVHESRFQRIMKSRRSIASQDSLFIQYHVYDCVEENLSYNDRRILISEVIIEMMDEYEKKPFVAGGFPIPFPIQSVRSVYGDKSETQKYHDLWKGENYEGVMIRNPDATYDIDTRSYALQKYKMADKDYFKIVDVIASPKRKNEGVLVCKTTKGVTFKCTIAGTKVMKEQALRNPLFFVGKFMLIEYRGISEEGKPTHAVGIELINP
jgi:ATP-dependent DNA ligase